MRFLFILPFALPLAFVGKAGDGKPNEAKVERLAQIVDFTLRLGTNKPVSEATAKALGLGDSKLPATQIAILPTGETQFRAFAVSTRNTNDLVLAWIDKDTRSGKVWLTAPDGQIRVTVLVSSNSPPQVVSNDRHAGEFADQIEFFLAMVLLVEPGARTSAGGDEKMGPDRSDASGTVREISDQFGHDELLRLYELLNSAEFQAPLTNYNCGDPVPKLAFSVSLRPEASATTRAVTIYHSPELSPSGPTRCLMSGVGYLLDKAVARLDPDPRQEDTREPHCDCSKRGGKEEWVSFPGPAEVLAHARVAAKKAPAEVDKAK